jgi:hypothetical protein
MVTRIPTALPTRVIQELAAGADDAEDCKRAMDALQHLLDVSRYAMDALQHLLLISATISCKRMARAAMLAPTADYIPAAIQGAESLLALTDSPPMPHTHTAVARASPNGSDNAAANH